MTGNETIGSIDKTNRVNMNRILGSMTLSQISILILSTFAAVGLLAFATQWIHFLRFITTLVVFLYLAIGFIFLTALYQKKVYADDTNKAGVIAVAALCLACLTWIISPKHAAANPVFQTPLSGKSTARPAIKVHIRNDNEFFGNAELYLSVQSSCFPNNTYVIFPLNVGDFSGCTSRFIQLPFEVREGDVILLNLLDEDGLTSQEVENVLGACKTAGYILAIAGKMYQPELSYLIHPAFMTASEVLGNSIISYGNL